ncbi:hypothetical protein ALC53_08623 [Atta colombica]|uniref:Uncharacterized protein n=1 Tax=Atta colombica TaxID=520822 RepID=A0A151I316_9HYME|nr:hypothetical protein ALC53_08623 [Atta colombica]
MKGSAKSVVQKSGRYRASPEIHKRRPMVGTIVHLFRPSSPFLHLLNYKFSRLQRCGTAGGHVQQEEIAAAVPRRKRGVSETAGHRWELFFTNASRRAKLQAYELLAYKRCENEFKWIKLYGYKTLRSINKYIRQVHRLMRGGALQVGGLARGRQCLSRVGMPVVYSEMQEAQEIKKRSSKHQARFVVKADSQAYLNIMLHELLNFPMVSSRIIEKSYKIHRSQNYIFLLIIQLD